ncbi:hypothetical protein K439DRAFT_507100 [Ramaria rubella]|nr:hypothetical protein K439DRAFT_507100 [Ramaria rubella]
MYALRTPSFFKPASRSSSPAPAPAPTHLPSLTNSDAGMALESLLPSMARSSSKGALNRLALTSRKRPVSAPTPLIPPIPTLVQDGSYLEALSLKLSEAVSKALAQPTGAPAPGEVTLNGKRALPKGRGSALGALIGSELEASAANSHLHRAILRSLHRPLSVLHTRLSAQLLPLISSPQFTAHPTPTVPNATQLFAIGYAAFAAELLQSLDVYDLFQTDPHNVGATDNLRGIREGLESLIGRVANPLSHGIKSELLPYIEALEHSTPFPVSPPSHAKQGTTHHLKGAPVHPSIVALQGLVPAHVRNLVLYTAPPTMSSQTMMATLLISLVWRSLVSLSQRIMTPTPCGSPILASQQAGAGLRKKLVGSSTTPPNTPPPTRFSIKLPPSRPPSPPATQISCPATDARSLYNLLNVFPRPHENSRYAIAREAVDEAFGSLAALCALLDYEAAGDLEDLEVATADLPTVIALPVLLRILAGQCKEESAESWTVPALLGVTDQEYRDACLSGFGRAEECSPLVAKRVLDALVIRRDARCERIIHWLEGRTSLGD